MDRAQASAFASTAADWIDADDAALSGGAESSWYTDMEIAHATAGTAFVSLSELRALRGGEPDLVAAILPHVCLGQPGISGRLNLNTLTPEQAVLLPALFSSGLDLPTARRLIEARPVSGWQGVEEFLSLDEISRLAEDIRNPDVLSVETSRIRSHMIVRFGNQKRPFDIMFDRQGAQVEAGGHHVDHHQVHEPRGHGAVAVVALRVVGGQVDMGRLRQR